MTGGKLNGWKRYYDTHFEILPATLQRITTDRYIRPVSAFQYIKTLIFVPTHRGTR